MKKPQQTKQNKPSWKLTATDLRSRLEDMADELQISRNYNKKLQVQLTAPVPMLLFCPSCGARHIDKGEFATRAHHAHACQNCGMTWRPAVVATVGVQFLPGFKDGDTLMRVTDSAATQAQALEAAFPDLTTIIAEYWRGRTAKSA